MFHPSIDAESVLAPELRYLGEAGGFLRGVFSLPRLAVAPKEPRGDGGPIRVLPGYLCGDLTTIALRRYLRWLGYRAKGWGLGINKGEFEDFVVEVTALVQGDAQHAGRRVRIVGESSVATLAADGPHVLRRNGSVLEVSSDGELGASLDGFSILKAPRNLDEFRSLGLGKELFLRVNPDIEVDVEVTGGSLNTERVPRLGKVRLTAGAAKLLDVEVIKDALIQAGQATVKGTITRGRSRIRAESGSLSIQLTDASNVTVHGESQLGKVSWSGGHSGAGDEVVMGNGSARLDVEVVMGHASVKVGNDQPAEHLR